MLPLSNMSASSMTCLSTLQHHDTKLDHNRLRESYRAQMPKQRWVKQSVQEIVGRLAIKPPLRLAASHKTPRPFPEARREANLQTRQKYTQNSNVQLHKIRTDFQTGRTALRGRLADLQKHAKARKSIIWKL